MNIFYTRRTLPTPKGIIGHAQLYIFDHVSPSTSMGDKESTSSFNPYILLITFENANLHLDTNVEKIKQYLQKCKRK